MGHHTETQFIEYKMSLCVGRSDVPLSFDPIRIQLESIQCLPHAMTNHVIEREFPAKQFDYTAVAAEDVPKPSKCNRSQANRIWIRWTFRTISTYFVALPQLHFSNCIVHTHTQMQMRRRRPTIVCGVVAAVDLCPLHVCIPINLANANINCSKIYSTN